MKRLVRPRAHTAVDNRDGAATWAAAASEESFKPASPGKRRLGSASGRDYHPLSDWAKFTGPDPISAPVARLSFQLPAHTGKYFVHQPLVGLVDEGEFEPPIAAQGIQTPRELDLSAGGKVIQIVCGAESQHAG